MAKAVDISVNFTIKNCDAEFVKFFGHQTIAEALQKAGLFIDSNEIEILIPNEQASIIASIK